MSSTGGAGEAGGRSRSAALVAYVLGLAALAGALTALVADTRGDLDPAWWALPVFVVLLAVAEYFFVRFHYREQVNALNVVEAVLAPVLFAFPPAVAVVAIGGAELIASAFRRNTPVKSAFNVAQWCLATALGAAVVASTAPGSTFDGDTAAAVVLALTVVAIANQAAFTFVLAIAERQSPTRVLSGLAPVIVPGWLVGWAVNALMGLLFVLAYATSPWAVLLFPGPLLVLHLAYRGLAGVRADRVRLAGLHRAAKTLADPVNPEDAVEPFLRQVVASFEARAAALVLVAEGGRFVHRVEVGTPGMATSFQGADERSLEAAVLELGGARRLTARDEAATAALLGDAGCRDCLVAPLGDESQPAGALAVFDQTGLEGFEKAELAVLEALARETGGILGKGRLLATVLEERRKLDEIVTSASDGIFSLSSDGTVLSWNPAMAQITGLPTVAVVGRRRALAELSVRTPDGTAVDLAGWATTGALPTDVVVHGRRGDRQLSCSYSETLDADGHAETLVVVARDLTTVAEMRLLRERFGELAQAEAAHRAVVDQLQQALMPTRPTVAGLDLGISYLSSDPTAPTGGDLYDWQVLPSGEVHVAVVDVLGHGVTATHDALSVVHTLRLLAFDGCPLERLVERAGGLLSAQDPELVATAVVVRYEPDTGVARVASGGHPPAIVVPPHGPARLVEATGGAIGWPNTGSVDVAEVRLGPGDSLVLYTDGLVEARKDIIEGLDRMRRHAVRLAGASARDMAAGLVERAVAGAARRDDTLALVLRRAPATPVGEDRAPYRLAVTGTS